MPIPFVRGIDNEIVYSLTSEGNLSPN